jgi:hypothetical protein
VSARKFANLHLYGCWWFCNNPSLIQALTAMRLEMLGSAFTSQHSDSRVLEHLIYKWSHSALTLIRSLAFCSSLSLAGRQVIANVLTQQFLKIAQSGWPLSRSEINRTVHLVLGGSYEEFMAKKLS